MTDNREKIRFWINGEALFTELGTTVSSLLKKSHGVEMPCGGRHACGRCMRREALQRRPRRNKNFLEPSVLCRESGLPAF